MQYLTFARRRVQGFVEQSAEQSLLRQTKRRPATPRGLVLQRQTLLEHLPARRRDPHEVRAAVGGIATTVHERQRFEPVHQTHHRVRVNRAALAQRRLALRAVLDEHGEQAKLRRGQAKRGEQAAELAQRVLIGLVNEKTERVGQMESGCVTRRDRHVRNLVSIRIICLRTDSRQAALRVLSCPARAPAPAALRAENRNGLDIMRQHRLGHRRSLQAARSGWGGTADPHRQTDRRAFESQANEE
jgi:hypothetical protein